MTYFDGYDNNTTAQYDTSWGEIASPGGLGLGLGHLGRLGLGLGPGDFCALGLGPTSYFTGGF